MSEKMSSKKYYSLKWLAIVTMFADHLGAVLNEPCHFSDATYLSLRFIGRLAMPLFCFMLTESFHYTTSKRKHLLKILALALISEIPYDLCRYENVIDLTGQNVCFTLALGFLCLWITNSDVSKATDRLKMKWFKNLVKTSFQISVSGLFMLIAFLFRCDGNWYSIMMIMLFDSARGKKHPNIRRLTAILLYIASTANAPYLMCLLDLPLIIWACRETNQTAPEKSANQFGALVSRYFYPVHLALLYIVKVILT